MKKTLSCCTLAVGNNTSNYLSSLYLVVKFLFLFNNLLQFLILSAFLQLNFWQFGTKTLQTYSQDYMNTATTQTFPIVALCHFQTYDKHNATGKGLVCRKVSCVCGFSFNSIQFNFFLLSPKGN